MFTCAFPVCKPTGRFNDDIDFQRFPRQFFRIFDREDFDGLSIDENLVILGLDAFLEGADTSASKVPRTESYLSRYERVLASVKSLMATNSRSGSPMEARSTLRPMRPKPLIPIRMAIAYGPLQKNKPAAHNL